MLIYEGREWVYRDEQIVGRLQPRQQALRSAAEWLWPRRKGIGGAGPASREAIQTVADAVLSQPLLQDDDGEFGFDVAEFGMRIGDHRAVEDFKYPGRKLRQRQLLRRAQAASQALIGGRTCGCS